MPLPALIHQPHMIACETPYSLPICSALIKPSSGKVQSITLILRAPPKEEGFVEHVRVELDLEGRQGQRCVKEDTSSSWESTDPGAERGISCVVWTYHQVH